MKKQIKRFTALAVFCALILSFAACGEQTEAPAALTFEESNYTLQLPIYALTEEKTPETSCRYSEFLFDKYGKLLGKKAEGDQNGSYNYLYNEQGLLEEENFTCDEGYLKVTYTYNDDGFVATKRITSDYSDKNWTTYSYTYTLDDYDRPAEMTVTNQSGEWRNTVITYQYDNASEPVQETQKFFKYSVGETPDKTCVVTNSFDDGGNLTQSVSVDQKSNEKTVSTYKYECIEHRTIYSKSEDHLKPTDDWKTFDESPYLPSPDSCSKKLAFSQKNNTENGVAYVYRILENQDESTQFEGADRYLLEYKTILTQMCGITLETQEDKSVRILKDEAPLAVLSMGIDKQNNNLCIITFKNEQDTE